MMKNMTQEQMEKALNDIQKTLDYTVEFNKKFDYPRENLYNLVKRIQAILDGQLPYKVPSCSLEEDKN